MTYARTYYPRVVRMLLVSLSIGMLCWLLWNMLRFGRIRYFDADEMAYLHWAHNVFVGKVPYIDFLSYVPPGFYYVLAPLFWLTEGVEILTYARVFACSIFLGTTLTLIYLFWHVRKSWTALIAGIVLAWIPIPSDKFIEVRPDTISMMVALGATLFQVLAFRYPFRSRYWFFSGFLYSVSFLLLPKVVPQILSAVFVIVCWWIWGEYTKRERTNMLVLFGIGLMVPFLLFGVWVMSVAHSIQQIGVIWYSLTRLPLEVNKIGALFPMEPYQFFYPNALLYGIGGWNTIIFSNHVFWFIGLGMGACRLVTPFLPNGKNGVWAELLIGISFFGYITLFMYGYPMRHEQYLIPIGVFVSFYVADICTVVWTRMQNTRITTGIFFVGFVCVLGMLFFMSQTMGRTKQMRTNVSEYETLRVALMTIPKDAYVFDLVGSTIYFRDPYYVSAVPFGQWEPYLSRPLPSVVASLEKTKTRYIYEGGLGRVNTLRTQDAMYIARTFLPGGGIFGLWVRK